MRRAWVRQRRPLAAAPPGLLGRLLVAAAVGLLALGTGCRRPVSESPPAVASVTGRVGDLNGTPLAGALVALVTESDDGRVPVGSARTTATGAFHIDRVPAGHYRVRVRAAGHVETVIAIDVKASGVANTVDLKLPVTVSLRGHVEDERHTPVPLARVLAFAIADVESRGLHESRADEQGVFSLDGLTPGAHRLLISAPGLGTASAGPVTAPDSDVVVVVPGQIRVIVGRVTRDRQPVSNARVTLGGEGVPEPRGADTHADGRFAFGGLGPGTYLLRAEQGGLVAPALAQVIIDRSPSQTRAVELVLAPGTFARGKVVGQDGRPVAGASVQIDLASGTGLLPVVATDSDGNWSSAPLGPGTYRFRARHPGTVARRTVIVEIGRPAAAAASAPVAGTAVVGAGTTTPVATAQVATTIVPPLELVRTGRITGVVVDERGHPLAGAAVHDRLAETENLGVIWSRLPLAAEAAALPSGTVLPSTTPGMSPSRRATTDAAGRFVLADVPPGRVRVEVLNPSSVPLRTPSLKLAPGATLDVGALRIQRAIQVSGRTLDGDGRPLAGVRVGATRLSTPADLGAGLYAVTSDDGMFSLPLSAGEHRLTASARGQADVSETIHVGGGGAPTPFVTLRLTKSGDTAVATRGNLSLQGTVRDAERRPLAGARVSAFPLVAPSAAAGKNSGRPATLATAVADAGGGFRMTGLPTGAVSLEVTHDRYAPHRQVVDVGTLAAAGRAIEIEVPLPGRIDGEVHESLTGGPVAAFQIDARGPDGASARYPEGGKRARDGGPLRFSLRRLVPGRWTLRVTAPGFRPTEHLLNVAPATSPGEPSVRDLRLELGRT